MKFCITGLPRSRTAWFSAYFTACGSLCVHEGMNGCETIEEYFEKMENIEGNSDSGISMYPHNIPTIIIERNIEDVKKSLSLPNMEIIDILQKKMDKLEGLRVRFEDIDERLQEITEYCGVPYQENIAEIFKNMIITIKKVTVDDKTINLMEGLLCQHGQ